MAPMLISYTVGIRRRFLPFFRKFSVTAHDTESLPGCLRLHLQLLDGSQLVMPGMERKIFKVYPDYRNAEIQLAKLRSAAGTVVPIRAERPADDVDVFDDLLRARQEAVAK